MLPPRPRIMCCAHQRDVRRTKKVHAQGLVPRTLPLLVAGIGDRVRLEDTGVVHQHVQAAQSIACGVDHPPDHRCVSEIRADDDVPVARERRRDLRGQIGSLSVMDSDTITSRRERARNRGAYSTRRPGNKHRSSITTAPLPVILCEPDGSLAAAPVAATCSCFHAADPGSSRLAGRLVERQSSRLRGPSAAPPLSGSTC